MNRMQLENIYRINGINDFRLRSLDDLMRVHGVDFAVNGYANLSDENKELYKRFLINYYNTLILETRAELTLEGIYWVKYTEYVVEVNGMSQVAKGIIKAMNADGTQGILLNECSNSEYDDDPTIQSEPQYYLLLAYEQNGLGKWLQIIDETNWQES